MLLAHTAGASGPHTEYLFVGAALVVLALVFFAQRSVKPVVSIVLLLAGFSLVVGAFTLNGGEDVEVSATLQLVAPEDGATVDASEPVEVRVDLSGASLTTESTSDDPKAGHLHVYVDGDLIAMPTEESFTVEVEPGERQIKVEFTRPEHGSFDPPVVDFVTVTAE